MKNNIENVNDFFIYYKQAAWNKDVNGMVGLYDEHVLIFDMWGEQGFHSGIEEWSLIISNWLTSLMEEKVNVVFDRIEIHEGDVVAFATALIQFEAITLNNEVLRSMRNRISLGFVKSDGSWKVKHQHTSSPIDSNLKAVLDM